MDLPTDGSYIFSGAGIHGPCSACLVAAPTVDAPSGGDILALHQSGLAAAPAAITYLIFGKDGR